MTHTLRLTLLARVALLSLPIRGASAQPAEATPDACLDRLVPYSPGATDPPDEAVTLRLDPAGSGALLYLGARHTSDPADPQIATLRSEWTAFRPTLAFYEGPDRPLGATADETVRQTGESGYVRWLAAADSLPTAGLEPAPGPHFAAVSEAVGTEPAALFFVLREAARLRDRRGTTGADLDAAVTRLLQQAAPLGLPFADLEGLAAAYARQFAGYPAAPADWREAPGDWFSPRADDAATGGRFMGAANRASSGYRNRAMVQALADAVARGERVLAVVGRDHVPAQAAALRCLVGAPAR